MKRQKETMRPLSCYTEQVNGALAEKLGNGLQNRVDGSVTRRCLHKITLMYSELFLLQNFNQLREDGVEKMTPIIKHVASRLRQVQLEFAKFSERNDWVVFAVE